MASTIHYEVFVRKTIPDSWSLSMACESRQQAVDTAEELLASKRVCAVRVLKETLNPATGEFNSVVILTRGAPELKPNERRKKEPDGPICQGFQDLYAPHAREKIGRVLDDWLYRNVATTFELLHRPDLAEKLEASGVELQHAIQKVAVPESQSSGQSVHELVRHYQKLCEQAIERVLVTGRRKLFPNLEKMSFTEAVRGLNGKADRVFLMGGAVAGRLIGIKTSRSKLDRLMDLSDTAPTDPTARAMALAPIEQILCELMATSDHLTQILGPSLDQGGCLAAIVRMVAPREIQLLTERDARLALLIPPVEGPPARLGEYLARGEFPQLAASLARMVLRELKGQKRLRPSDPVGEIDILRALALSLTATAGRLLSMDEVQTAFIERSRNLVTADFVTSYTKTCATLQQEAEALAWLCENVTGQANKRAAARWLQACVVSLRFENEMRGEVRNAAGQVSVQAIGPGATKQTGQMVAHRLMILSRLQKAVEKASLSDSDREAVVEILGKVGGVVEADVNLITQIGRATVTAAQKLSALLKLAAAETGPTGPVAERAKAEAVRLFRQPETRSDLTGNPEAVMALRPLMQAAGLAA